MNDTLTVEGMKYIIGRLLKNAEDSIKEYDRSRGEERVFASGRKEAYYEMLNVLKTELDARGQDLEAFGLNVDLVKKYA